MFIVLLINRGNAFSVHAYVTDALGFLSPINYVIEPKGRFRNEMEKESATLLDVELPHSERSGERTRHVTSLHMWEQKVCYHLIFLSINLKIIHHLCCEIIK